MEKHLVKSEKRIVLGAVAISQFSQTTHTKYIHGNVDVDKVIEELLGEGLIEIMVEKFYKLTPKGWKFLNEFDPFKGHIKYKQVDDWVDRLK